MFETTTSSTMEHGHPFPASDVLVTQQDGWFGQIRMSRACRAQMDPGPPKQESTEMVDLGGG